MGANIIHLPHFAAADSRHAPEIAPAAGGCPSQNRPLTIAQRFSAGLGAGHIVPVPSGTAESSFVPAGTFARDPALKGWAIFIRIPPGSRGITAAASISARDLTVVTEDHGNYLILLVLVLVWF